MHWKWIIVFFSLHAFSLPEKLSQTGLYQDIENKVVAPENRAYVPQYPLWSDGSSKHRWIFLPKNTQIHTEDPDHWVFPVGTKLWKEFAFLKDGRSVRVETRLIEKVSEEEWQVGTYLWEEDEKDAHLAPEDGIKDYFPIGPALKHDIPSVVDCQRCHRKSGDGVLGFDAIQLSVARDPFALHAEPVSPTDLNLKALIKEQRLSHSHASFQEGAPHIVGASPTARTVYGYFHSNCASCHNPVGSSMQMNLNFQYRLSATSEGEVPAYASSVEKRCQVFAFPGISKTFRVKRGSLEQSALIFLMQHTGESHMPPISVKTLDTEAIELIKKWILTL